MTRDIPSKPVSNPVSCRVPRNDLVARVPDSGATEFFVTYRKRLRVEFRLPCPIPLKNPLYPFSLKSSNRNLNLGKFHQIYPENLVTFELNRAKEFWRVNQSVYPPISRDRIFLSIEDPSATNVYI